MSLHSARHANVNAGAGRGLEGGGAVGGGCRPRVETKRLFTAISVRTVINCENTKRIRSTGRGGNCSSTQTLKLLVAWCKFAGQTQKGMDTCSLTDRVGL
jgi:hypothetical protein